VFGYHGVAYGHYAQATRPYGIALGSEAHVYSEGAMGVGYDVDIATNSPYSMGIGLHATIPSGMTNAIVIGMPPFTDINNRRPGDGSVTGTPQAMKSNSINFVFNGNGLEDFFIDGTSLQKRMGSEMKVVGNTKEPCDEASLREFLKLSNEDKSLVLASGDGPIRLYTRKYIEALAESDGEDVGDALGELDEIEVNGKSLKSIIQSGVASGFEEWRTTMTNEARIAEEKIMEASNTAQMKAALTNFLHQIAQ